MHFYLYKITNKRNSKFYIGVHRTEDLNDGYFGSGRSLKRDIKKYGKASFKKEILKKFTNETEMLFEEATIVTREFCSKPYTYNLMPSGSYGSAENNGLSFKGKTHTKETKDRIRNTRLEASPTTPETKIKQSLNNFARRNPIAQKEHAKKAGSYQKTNLHRTKLKASLIKFNTDPKNIMKGGRKNRGLVRPKITCPYCLTIGAMNVMSRFHFNRCKKIHNYGVVQLVEHQTLDLAVEGSNPSSVAT